MAAPTEGPGILRDEARGVWLAVAAYAAWGFLSPVGSLLLDAMGPFTLNALRTLLALPLLVVVFGARVSRAALASVARDPAVWVVGVVWLGLTFVPYLWSLKFLPPTIATLTVYLAPLLVAGWQRFVFRQRVSPFAVPTVVLTLAGGWLATREAGVALDRDGSVGLALALVGVVGWTGYTVHLKVLTRTRDPNTLTLAAFVTSAVAFAVGASAVEGFAVEWDATVARNLALYVLLPTFVSFSLYTASLKFANATTVAVLIGVELVSTAVVSHFMTGEAFTGLKLAGLAVVLLAVTLYLWDENRRPSARAVPG